LFICVLICGIIRVQETFVSSVVTSDAFFFVNDNLTELSKFLIV